MRARWWWCVVLAGALGAAWAEELPTVSLTARGLPLAQALETLSLQLGRRLVVEQTVLPPAKLDLLLRRAEANFAFEQVLVGTELTYEILPDRVVVRARPALVPSVGAASATGPRPAALPTLASVPAAVVGRVADALWDCFRRPTDARALAGLAGELRALRPDWREPLGNVLAPLWQSWDTRPVKLLSGAQVLRAAGALEAAGRLAQGAAVDLAVASQAYGLLARLAFDRGEFLSAVQMTSRNLLTADDPDVASTRALARYELGEDDMLGLADAITAESRWPRSASVQAAVGLILWREGGGRKAAGAMLKAHDLDHRNPDALFGLAQLAAADNEDAEPAWRSFLAVEPCGPRAERVRLGAAVVGQAKITERGGYTWRFSPDGERVLFTDGFRKQLQMTDARGMGLAVQLTDQEEDKAWASWSPDEAQLAWICGPPSGPSTVYYQPTHASGSHKAVLSSEPGHVLRRTSWSPDGKLLVVTDWDVNARAPKLRCWNRVTGQEVPPPAPLDQPGLGDADWQADGSLLVTVTDTATQRVVWLPVGGEPVVLRPAAPVGSYVAPSLDSGRRRVLAFDEGTNLLTMGPADGSEASTQPVFSRTSGQNTRGAVWSPRGISLAVSLRGWVPSVVRVDGLHGGAAVRLLRLPGPTGGSFRFALPDAGTSLQATLVADDGRELPLGVGTGPLAEFTPPAQGPGGHWLRVVASRGGLAEPARWYKYTTAAP